LPDEDIWDQYWHFDRIASCFDGAGGSNYDESIARGWRAFFKDLPDGTHILDLCTGNGAVPLIAVETGRAEGKEFEIVAVDQADIDPAGYVPRHAEDFARVRFVPATDVEALPFPDAGFGAVTSQYGIEYADLDRALPEAARQVAPGGRLRLVVHAADGVVAADALPVIAEADWLLDEIGLTDRAARCLTAVTFVEREEIVGAAKRREADALFAAFQDRLAQTAARVPTAHDRAMFKNSGAVLLDTFKRRSMFRLDQLLAKVAEVEGQIVAHRARLQALVEAGLDAAGAAALAERLRAAGATAAGSKPLGTFSGLVGHVIEARF
jgi:ubiquinone/menaquinone biosynthesis C-methylase UbiE